MRAENLMPEYYHVRMILPRRYSDSHTKFLEDVDPLRKVRKNALDSSLCFFGTCLFHFDDLPGS